MLTGWRGLHALIRWTAIIAGVKFLKQILILDSSNGWGERDRK
jgi:hypothetical protein